MKTLAKEALMLMPPTSARDALVSAIQGEQPIPRQVAHVTRVLSTSSEDEEWGQVTRFVELTYEDGVLHFATYDNTASVVGAHQVYDCQVRSDQPLDAEGEAKLRRWMEEWRELLALCRSGWGPSIY